MCRTIGQFSSRLEQNTCVTLTAAINLPDFRGDFSSGRLPLQTFSTCALGSLPLSSAATNFCQIITKYPLPVVWRLTFNELFNPSVLLIERIFLTFTHSFGFLLFLYDMKGKLTQILVVIQRLFENFSLGTSILNTTDKHLHDLQQSWSTRILLNFPVKSRMLTSCELMLISNNPSDFNIVCKYFCLQHSISSCPRMSTTFFTLCISTFYTVEYGCSRKLVFCIMFVI